jgi:hypothetical protein
MVKAEEMAKKSTNHVLPTSSGWAVKKSGAVKASRSFQSKVAAIRYARGLSRNEKTELYIHGKNGMIQDNYSYGNDPIPQKEKNL